MSEIDRSKKAADARAKKKYKQINKSLKKLSKSFPKVTPKSSAIDKEAAKKFAKTFKKEMREKRSFKGGKNWEKSIYNPKNVPAGKVAKGAGYTTKIRKNKAAWERVNEQLKAERKWDYGKVAKKTPKKGIAKKVISKLGLPGKIAFGVWTAYDVAKGIKDVKTSGKSCKPGQYLNKKGICVSSKKVRKQPKQ